MKIVAILLAGALVFSCNSNKSSSTENLKEASVNVAGAASLSVSTGTSAYKKYDMKSGIVTFSTVMSMGKMEINTKRILYFDDYGLKECEEEYSVDGESQTLDSRNFVKDGMRYSCSVKYKGGTKTKALGYGVAAAFNMEEAEKTKNNQFSKLADETVCGKLCNGFSMVTGSGTIQMYGWKRVCLKTTVDNASMKLKTTTTATTFEENVAIPADKFEVPAGVVLTDK